MEKTWFVYIHISPTQKYYVGITSNKPQERWRKNGAGYRGQPFYNAILKYGWDNLRHIVIASNISEEDAKNLEIGWIERLGSNKKNNGYNIAAGGDGTAGISYYGESNPFYGKSHCEETRKYLSNLQKEYYQTHSHPRSRAIYQFDMDGVFICEHENARIAEMNTGIDHSVIARVCNGKLNSTHGYIWAYKDDVPVISDFIEQRKIRLTNKALKIGQGNNKPVLVFDANGTFLGRYQSASAASKQYGVHKDTVSYACKHNSLMCGQYRCQYDGGDFRG